MREPRNTPSIENGAVTSDIAHEVIEMVRCRLSQHGDMDVIAAGFAHAFDLMARGNPACAVMRRVVAKMLAEDVRAEGRGDAGS